MNVGLKIFPEVEEGYVDKFAGNIDFIEIFAAPGSNYYFVAKYELPVVIHASHSQFGVNYCNPDKIEINEKTLSWAKMLADRFNSSKIIIHPEFIENEKCTMEYLANFIIKHHDPRLLIENMPFAHGQTRHPFLWCNPEELQKVMEQCSIGFDLDLNHAAGGAYGQGIPLESFLKSLLVLNPSHFHISDVNLKKGDEVHHNFHEGTADTRLLKSLLPSDAWVTLETPTGDFEKQKKEIEFLRK